MTTETYKGQSHQHKSRVRHLGLKENEPGHEARIHWMERDKTAAGSRPLREKTSLAANGMHQKHQLKVLEKVEGVVS